MLGGNNKMSSLWWLCPIAISITSYNSLLKLKV